MKHPIRFLALPVLIPVLVAILAVGTWAASVLTVQVSSTRLREDAKFWAASIETVSAGAALNEVARSGAWIQVRSVSGKTGWVHESAVMSKRVVLGGGSRTADTVASSDEIALAGKGFNEQVEGEYKKANTGLDFKAVDRMATFTVSEEEALQFLKDGKLADWGKES